jgi:protein SCO1/2
MIARDRFRIALITVAAAAMLAGGLCASAQDMLSQNPTGKPEVLKNVGFDQKLDSQIPLDLAFRDDKNNSVALRQFFTTKPVVLTLVYYQCPMLCTEVLNGTLNSLKEVPLAIGTDYEIVTVSIDPNEKPPLAEAKHTMYAGLLNQPGAVAGWHFLTGNEEEIRKLSASVGFRYVYDPASKQFAHAAGVVILTPSGRVSRYLFGLEFPPRDMRLALVEASSQKIGSPITDAILLYCFHYDPTTGKYGLVITNIVRAAGALTALCIAIAVIVLFRRERYALAAHPASPQRN